MRVGCLQVVLASRDDPSRLRELRDNLNPMTGSDQNDQRF